ncbi:MAG: hypothetical protein IJW37_09670 [Lachnospiraceae bacterium]|nr:hypothetical protein [Lachnospiraceae bacterium]
MKKRVATISTVLVLACAIVALYWYIDRNGGAEEKPAVNTVAEQMLAKDLEKNYPPTPYSVAELYCGTVECIYNPETTEEQIEGLVKMQLQLFDEEFAALNPYEQFLDVTKEELAEAKEKGIVFTGYVLDKATNVQKWENVLGSYASLQFQLLSRSDEGGGGSYRNLIMRKDKDGKYKIVGWQTAEDGGNDSADTGN